MFRSLAAAAALILATLLAGTSGAAAQELVPCAREHGFCHVPYPTRVVYGVPGRRVAVEVAGRGVSCSNEVFGDPAPGIPKRCAYMARPLVRPFARRFGGPFPREHRPRHGWRGEDYGAAAWRTCAEEHGFCGFRGMRRVRYGARGRYAEGVYRGGVGCNNGTFGDPAPGVRKHCQIVD